jgi:dihydroorotase
MNPPLRSEENRLETIKALLDGTACMIASDHAPHTKEEKSKPYNEAPNGIIGIETMLPLIYTNFIDTGLATYNDFLNWFVNNPRKVFSLSERKIEVGYQADITVLDINTKRRYTKNEILSLSTNCPYINMEMKGFPILTIYKGKIVWEEK